MTHISPTGPLIREIPLSRLALAPENVRKTPADDLARAELAASIRAHGLLENLVARADKRGLGRRRALRRRGRADCRLAALRTLAEEGAIPADHPVPCLDQGRLGGDGRAVAGRERRPHPDAPGRPSGRLRRPCRGRSRRRRHRRALRGLGAPGRAAAPARQRCSPSFSTPTAPGRSTWRPSRRSRSPPTMPASARCGSRSRGRAIARPRGR